METRDETSAAGEASAADETAGEAAPSGRRAAIGFWLGLVLFAAMLLYPAPAGMRPEAQRMAATILLMGCWWIAESLPLGVTALVPLVAFPLLGIMGTKEVAPNYADHYVFLLIGGFFIALSMQKWNLHARLALWIIRAVGTSARRLVLGFILASGFISLWISNSATAMMMMPIGLGLVSKVEEMRGGARDRVARNFGICIMLGIAYAASIGGVGTLVGTFPNVVFAGMFAKHFPGAPPITFVAWLKAGLPFVVVFLPIMWLYLITVAAPVRGRIVEGADEIVRRELAALGKMGRGEKLVLAVFVATALLWITREDVVLGGATLPGWAGLLGLGRAVDDSTVAMGMGILCFLLPAGGKGGVRLLDWKTAAQGLPWGILLLFGGGFAVAAGFEESGLTEWLGQRLAAARGLPMPVMIAMVAAITMAVTEMTSNTATTTMVLPILAATARTLMIDPLLLMIPATIAASNAFMLPISTPPNAIVFSTGRVGLPRMAATGLALNLIGIVVLVALMYLWVMPVFGINPDRPPAWLTR